MTLFAALAAMAIVVLVIEGAALLFRATLPKDGRPAPTWTPLASGSLQQKLP